MLIRENILQGDAGVLNQIVSVNVARSENTIGYFEVGEYPDGTSITMKIKIKYWDMPDTARFWFHGRTDDGWSQGILFVENLTDKLPKNEFDGYVIRTKVKRSNTLNKHEFQFRAMDGIGGKFIISEFKVEVADVPSIWTPRHGELTEEQQNLMKYGEYTEIKSF